jgi:hypothetical protein
LSPVAAGEVVWRTRSPISARRRDGFTVTVVRPKSHLLGDGKALWRAQIQGEAVAAVGRRSS